MNNVPSVPAVRTLGTVLLLTLCFASHALADSVGDTWVQRAQLPSSETLNAAATNDLGTCVVVGNHGTIFTSSTGTSWTPQSSGVIADLQDVIWTGGRFIAVGYDGCLLWSVSGATWNATPKVDAAFTSVVWADSQAVAVGGTFNATTHLWSGAVFTSPDGLTWTRRTVTGAPYFFDVAWNGSVIAAAGNGDAALSGAVFTSPTGAVWTKRALPKNPTQNNNTVSSLINVGSAFLLTGSGTWTSTSGTAWLVNTSYEFLTGMMMRWSGAEFIATHPVDGYYYTSPDASAFTWTDRSGGLLVPPLAGGRVGSSLLSLSYGGRIDRQVALGTWSTTLTTSVPRSMYDVAHSGSLYVAVGTNLCWTSPDAVTWTQFTQASFDAQTVTWDGTRFIAAGNGVWTSTNGNTWTNTVPPQSSGTAHFFTARTVLGKTYLSGFDYTGNGTPLSGVSTDGVTWQPTNMRWPAFAFATDGTKVVAVGWYGAVMTSTNGTDWDLIYAGLPTDDYFKSLVFAGGQFVAGTSYGNLFTSATGAVWNFRDAVAGSVESITRTSNEYVAVCNHGFVARSFDGVSWRQLSPITSNRLNTVLWNGTSLVTVGEGGCAFTSDGTAAVQPGVTLAASASTMSETGGTVTITASLPAPWPINVFVPLAFSSTAIRDTDYTTSATSNPAAILISKGSTTGTLTLTAKADTADESDETLTVTALAPFGDVTLGSIISATVTLIDDDTKPTFGTPMADQLVAVGQPFVFSAPATGSSAITYQWKKNTTSLTGAKASSYSVTKAALTNAGEYAVEAKNLSGTVTSAPAKLGVVTVASKYLTQKTGTTGTFTASAAGAVSYQWKKGVIPLTDGGNITGATSPKLVITGMVPAETAIYTCEVTLGSLTMTASSYDFGIIDAKPVITAPSAMTVRVSQSIDLPMTCTNRPSSWKITNLPAGLQYSTTTGRITGKPTAVSTKKVTLIATNLYGPSDSATFDITVEALPTNTLGSFVTLLSRNTVNGDLGGRLDVATTSNGRYTGKLWNGGTSYSIDTYLNGDRLTNPTGHVHIVRPAPNAALDLDFSIDLTTGVLSATVTDGTTTATGTGLARAAATTNRTGAYNIALSPTSGSPSGTPEGHSYAQFTIAATGTFNAAVKLADNTAVTIATQTAADGSIPLFSSLYSGKGSFLGTLVLHEDVASSYANNFITGNTTWSKVSVGTGRSYAGGFPLFSQDADGGRWTKPTSGIVMNLTAGAGNAKARFTGANLSTASRNPDGDFTVASIATVTPPAPNLAATTLSFTTTTGLVSGQFVLSDTDTSIVPNKILPRTTPYYGIIIRPGGLPAMKALGHFNLAQMPTASPKTTSTTSPQLSGAVSITN